jgi:hypothetical protein
MYKREKVKEDTDTRGMLVGRQRNMEEVLW